jgi:Copper type II ascorbate-dependent monooxygenase, C-terminal domain
MKSLLVAPKNRSNLALAMALLGGGGLIGCSSSAAAPPSSNNAGVTYYKDVKPILDAKCASCHVSGGLAPFALHSYADAFAQKDAIAAATGARIMPPWPPNDTCATYAYDRSLAADQIRTIADWAQSGAVEGQPSQYAALATAHPSLSRVDAQLKPAQPYTPQLRPDDYHCFLLDWPATSDSFVTGIGVKPGAPTVVHHALIFAVPPAEVATYEAFEDTPGTGYTCFGGPEKTGTAAAASASLPSLLGGWAPGASGSDFPANTGLKVLAGSKIVVQVHYNTSTSPPTPDQTEVDFKVDASVETPAYFLPWTNPSWVNDHTMMIPAGNPEVSYAFSFDAMKWLSGVSHGVLNSSSPITVWSAALHQHLLGTRSTISVTHSDGSSECYLDIPHWDFHWQGSYRFAEPKTLTPGDALGITCHWNNSASNQQEVGGVRQSPMDVNWGEGTMDEMCLGFLYVTQ